MNHIDAHVHVWTPDTAHYPLAAGFKKDDMKPPSFTPEDLFKHSRPAGVTRVNLIQMSFYGFDNSYMLDMIKLYPEVFVGTAVIDPQAESVKRINTSFPHWFCGYFTAFNDAVEKLPFDQHCLAAICAPRPVLYTNAAEDLWANPSGQFEMLKLATPVYKLYGAGGLEADAMPEQGKLADSRLGYFIRPGKHSVLAEDWEAFLKFADRHFKK